MEDAGFAFDTGLAFDADGVTICCMHMVGKVTDDAADCNTDIVCGCRAGGQPEVDPNLNALKLYIDLLSRSLMAQNVISLFSLLLCNCVPNSSKRLCSQHVYIQ